MKTAEACSVQLYKYLNLFLIDVYLFITDIGGLY